MLILDIYRCFNENTVVYVYDTKAAYYLGVIDKIPAFLLDELIESAEIKDGKLLIEIR